MRAKREPSGIQVEGIHKNKGAVTSITEHGSYERIAKDEVSGSAGGGSRVSEGSKKRRSGSYHILRGKCGRAFRRLRVTSYGCESRLCTKFESMDITVVRRERNGQGMLTQDLRCPEWEVKQSGGHIYVSLYILMSEMQREWEVSMQNDAVRCS